MSTTNYENIKEEISHFLRYSDVLSTTVRGVTRTTEGYTVGVGGETTHTFTHPLIRDFVYVTVNAINKYFLRDYTFNPTTGVLTWNVALVQNDVVATQYDYGSGDKIYPDRPRDDLTLTSFPRIGIDIPTASTVPLGAGGTNFISDILITVFVWVPVGKDVNIAGGLGGTADLESVMTLIRTAIKGNAKGFYTVPWIYPKGRGPIIPGTNNKIMQMSGDFFARFVIE